MNSVELIEKFQCPGCVRGSDTKCGAFQLEETPDTGACCVTHILGTMMSGAGSFALGLPKGFNRPGFNADGSCKNKMNIRLWARDTKPEWDNLNVPVWAMEKAGFLYVRTYAPRTNRTWTDVVEGGVLEDVPGAINVGDFWEEID